ncbi:hypothetical protein VISP3789_08618 [Vibrio splendidus ATCC 33789]|nr:hypothetical protein VISP3789_08618 [Vibrio splendidus ATCC 33789]
MGRRRELGSIASGIVGSFASRNNDVDGYWGIGKLCKFAECQSSKAITVDLKNRGIKPSAKEFDLMVCSYSEMLFRLMGKRELPNSWLVSATIRVEFDVEYQHEHHYWRCELGKPCTLICEILDDIGRTHKANAYVNCLPHNPNRECRSSRFGNL